MSGAEGPTPFVVSLLSGAAAGCAVDLSLFPIDTVKTRLQSAEGFWKAGGFNGIYNGIFAAFLGSAPGAALFFTTYDYASHRIATKIGDGPATHMAAASLGEIAACLVRVPTENVKQKQQTGIYNSFKATVRGINSTQGFGGYYRGYGTTVMREIPFAFIQFPIWEKLKKEWTASQGSPVLGWQSALCGSLSGGLAAAVTTPLDVCKTRLMLDSTGKYKGMFGTMKTIHAEEGWRMLFSGLQPRVMWISIGGFVFFGGYEYTKRALGESDGKAEL